MNDNKVHTYTYMSDMWNTRLNLVRYRIELVKKILNNIIHNYNINYNHFRESTIVKLSFFLNNLIVIEILFV